uniref:Cytochrome P450 n=1 Tax=Oryza meridionalis TaxID=40149 RepID=A0A0E0EZQ3_9ORYZ
MSFEALGLTGGVITANPANVEYTLKTNFGNYPKGELAVSMLVDFLGHGIFNSDGEQWLWQQKAASYKFNKRSLRNFVVDTVRFEVVERLRCWSGRSATAGCWTCRTCWSALRSTTSAMSPSTRTRHASREESMASPQSAEFMRAFNDAQNAVMDRFMSPVKSRWCFKRLFNMEPERRLQEVLATIHGFAERIVGERRERVVAGLARSDDFLSRFAASGEHSNESLRDVVTNFLLVGRDTTSSALTWFLCQPLVEKREEKEKKR